MQVNLSKKAKRSFSKMNEPHKTSIAKALFLLRLDPPKGDIKPLTGTKNFRCRVGDYRIIFCIKDGEIMVLEIIPRGQAYKKGGIGK